MRWEPGETIVLEERWRDRLWAVRPLTVVADDGDELVLWCPKGAVRQVPWPLVDGLPTRLDRVLHCLVTGEWRLVDSVWSHWGWYVNLQEPYVRTPRGISAMDQMLDVVVEPDGTWRWKDEDEMAAAVALGLFSEEHVAFLRDEALSVVAEMEAGRPPFCEPWTTPPPRLDGGDDPPPRLDGGDDPPPRLDGGDDPPPRLDGGDDPPPWPA